MATVTLFTNQTADGQSAPFHNTDETHRIIILEGGLGGGTLKLQAQSPSTGNWADLDGAAWAVADMAYSLALPRGASYRASLDGATAAALTATIQ